MRKNERIVLRVIIEIADGKKACIIANDELKEKCLPFEISNNEMEIIIKNLALDGYLESIATDNKGVKYFCITLSAKGANFLRDQKKQKVGLISRVGITIAFAILSFIVTFTLKNIFT